MLDLRPNCEYCDKDLPPNATEAMICTYECTFCQTCVDSVLRNVCPNCGGGFERRPIRPATAHRKGVGLSHQPASRERRHLKHERSEIETFVAGLEHVPPDAR